MEQVSMPEARERKRILIADDSFGARVLLRTVLERQGFAVAEAENGAIALRQACEVQPDLIILDLNMPEKDGMTVATELRLMEQFCDVPIVALSAGLTPGDSPRLREAGFSHLLSKPVTPSSLRQCVGQILAQA